MIDLPGTYSLRGRSPDEAVTRDYVLGRLPSERRPNLLLCPVDAISMRLGLRLVLELKRAGIPMLLVLNMIDIASLRGIEIDTEQLAVKLGVQVVTSAAVRRDGRMALLSRLDAAIASEAGIPSCEAWQPPSAAKLFAALREADRIIRVAVKSPSRPDTVPARLDAALLHPVAGSWFSSPCSS